MPVSIVMPALSGDAAEANLLRWLKSEGDPVKAGEVIAEIETDKAILEVEATRDGRIGRILVPAGSQGIKPEQVIALLLDMDEGVAPAATATPSHPPADSPAAAAAGTESAPRHPSPPEAAAAAAQSGRIFASPLARRMAAQAGCDLSSLAGSGPRGRIVKADVQAALRESASAAPDSTLPAFTDIPHTMMRRTIARRLTQAKQQAPHFYLSIDCEIDALLELRREINAGGRADRISVNDIVIRAAALALKQVPAVNASWTEACVRQYHAADISVAVATPAGLIAPVVRRADTKSIETIAAEMRQLAARAQEGKLAPEEYQGGTFSISNLGMYGVREFAAVINPPQSAILAVGAGAPRPVARDGALAVATMMACTLSADHRVVDGVAGAEFLAAFKKLIEEPRRLLSP